MRHGKTVILSALTLILASPPCTAPAQAQDPGRMLRSLTSPLRTILRGVPRARHVPRAHRVPRAGRDVAGERSRPAPRRQLAQGPAVFWPIAAPDAFEDMLGYAFWPQDYGRQFWSHGPHDILRAMTAPAAAFASQDADRRSRRGLPSLVSSANAAGSGRSICIARVKDQAMRPLDRIAEAIRLNPEQRQGLDAFRAAVRSAIDG